MNQGDRIKAEFKKLKIKVSDLCDITGLSYSTLQRKLKEDKLSPKDIMVFGTALEKENGDPRKVWPNWDNLKASVMANNLVDLTDRELKKLDLIKSVPLMEGSPNQKSNNSITIPGFETLDCWVKIYNSDILCDLYRPGQIFGLKKVKSMDAIIYGSVHFISCESFESLRILKKLNDKNIRMIPLNKDLDPHDFDLRKPVDIYQVKGVISWT